MLGKNEVTFAVVIVNYRIAHLTIECLRSLAAQRTGATPQFEVVIVDNASGDGSSERLQDAVEENGWSSWIRVVAHHENRGFSAGNNVGLSIVLSQSHPPDFVLLLNPDTVAPPAAIAGLSQFLVEHPRAGIVGASLEDSAGAKQCAAHRFSTPLREFQRGASLGLLDRWIGPLAADGDNRTEARPIRCDWVSGAALCVRREVLQAIGLLDEGFFLYFEEVDFCKRAGRAGWEVWMLPHVRIVHREGASTGLRSRSSRLPMYWFDSRRRFFLKHHGGLKLLTADILWLLGRLGFRVRASMGLARAPRPLPARYNRDLLGGDMRAMLSRRRRSPELSPRHTEVSGTK
ncbi:MAG TPA: glycosyltransferase family 2 protein [Chthoniobacterales bacterium]|nr:glycosyltransferase family 2 protein [Chthoniobacterales bacterium]